MAARQPGLKATAPDSPLSSVLTAVNKSSQKADTAYRRAADLQRDLEQLGERVNALHTRTEGVATEAAFLGVKAELKELTKWRAKATQRLDAVVQFANDTIEVAKQVAAASEATTKTLVANYLERAEEGRELYGKVQALQRQLTMIARAK